MTTLIYITPLSAARAAEYLSADPVYEGGGRMGMTFFLLVAN